MHAFRQGEIGIIEQKPTTAVSVSPTPAKRTQHRPRLGRDLHRAVTVPNFAIWRSCQGPTRARPRRQRALEHLVLAKKMLLGSSVMCFPAHMGDIVTDNLGGSRQKQVQSQLGEGSIRIFSQKFFGGRAW